MKKSKFDNIEDADFIIISALRYALGRSSYAVSVMQDFLRKNWEDPIIMAKHDVFIRDIENHINTWEAHCKTENDKYQLQTWKDLLEELKSWKTQQQ